MCVCGWVGGSLVSKCECECVSEYESYSPSVCINICSFVCQSAFILPSAFLHLPAYLSEHSAGFALNKTDE